MKDDFKGSDFPLTKQDIKLKKLEKQLTFYRIYARKLEERLQKCREELKETPVDEGDST
tara:strand:- start:930 stop:1106 length:177 start_codon:yes stop_codon:yes gene_type:complete